MRRNQDPKIMAARFDSKCAETGKEIKKGDQFLYYPDGKKAYHLDSKQAQSYYEWKADQSMGYDY